MCSFRHIRTHNISTGTWWRHQMETFSALLALCAGNSTVTGEFPSQRPETRSFDVLFDLRLNKRLSKQSRGWWFETPSCSLWRHCNEIICVCWGLLICEYVTYELIYMLYMWLYLPVSFRCALLALGPSHTFPSASQVIRGIWIGV